MKAVIEKMSGDDRSIAVMLLDKYNQELCLLSNYYETFGKLNSLIDERLCEIAYRINQLLTKNNDTNN